MGRTHWSLYAGEVSDPGETAVEDTESLPSHGLQSHIETIHVKSTFPDT